MTTHAITHTILLYRAPQITSIWHSNNEVPSWCDLTSPSKQPLSLSHFSSTLRLTASQFYLKDHLLDSDSSCELQVTTFGPRGDVLTLPASEGAGLPFSLNEFIFTDWELHRLQLYIYHVTVKWNTALLVQSKRLEGDKKMPQDELLLGSTARFPC